MHEASEKGIIDVVFSLIQEGKSVNDITKVFILVLSIFMCVCK
jgi:hypothetical protein